MGNFFLFSKNVTKNNKKNIISYEVHNKRNTRKIRLVTSFELDSTIKTKKGRILQ